jgi:dienelactone hydrolase
MNILKSPQCFCALLCFFAVIQNASSGAEPEATRLPGTESLEWTDDIASRLVDGVDRFLLKEIEKSVERREPYWHRDYSSPEAYNKSIEPNRQRLAHILGVRDERVSFEGLELVATTEQPALVGQGEGFKVFAVRWPVIRNIHGEGLLLVPDKEPVADVIAIPDADQTPEMIVGLADGVPAESQFARRLAESGCRVVVPVLISREMSRRAPPGQAGRANLTNREFLYRSAFELGRHLIGYEVQKVLACVDWFAKEAGDNDAKVGVIGYGEGGMISLYAAALDPRIDVACVSGYFDSRQKIWQQPIDRNVFGLLEQFGDVELAMMIRNVIIDDALGPARTFPSEGGAPGTLVARSAAVAEFARHPKLLDALKGKSEPTVGYTYRFVSRHGNEVVPFCDSEILKWFVEKLAHGAELALHAGSLKLAGKLADPHIRQQRQMNEIDDHNQWLLGESPYVRAEFMKKLDTSSLEKYNESVNWYRDYFRDEVIGHFDIEPLPFNPRSRKSYDEEKWTGYEVVLDVFPDVIAYGILCVPKGIKPGEKRPVVVCQHGLEGRPQDVVAGDHGAYHDFAAKLAERGFVTFAPQNLYIFKDRFRTLQRKASPLGKTLFSIIVPQHQQIVDWLKTLDYVDPQRIAFYGLSYGGKSAMRIPPLVTDYCLSICSADFNEWVWKNASTRAPHSYVWTGEYEIFEFDLGSTFNYAEMAALIAPRPFMVERGHFDGVAPDETVAYEFAKVRNLYQARLGVGDRCEIEWFVGPHTINGKGTFDFLHKHLKWPKP